MDKMLSCYLLQFPEGNLTFNPAISTIYYLQLGTLMCNSEATVSLWSTLYLVMEPAILGKVAPNTILSDSQILCCF